MTCRICAIFLTVGKRSHALETLTLHEIDKELEVLFGLTWETHHERGAKMNARNFLADTSQKLFRLLASDMPKHSVEHMVGRMLKGNVEIFADIRVFSHHRQKVEREIVRIGIMKANPLDTRNLCYLLNKFCDIEPAIKILAIACQILSDELELMHSIGNERTDLLDYLFNRT